MKQNKKTLIVLTVVVLAIFLLLVVWLVQQPPSSRDTSVPGTAQPAEQVRGFGPPDEWFAAGVMGATYAETLAGEGFRTGTADAYLGQSPPDGPYLLEYMIGRAYPGWDTSALPDSAEILSATLVLDLPAGGGREKEMDITIYRGIWTPPLDLEDWRSPGSEMVGRWRLPASRPEERAQMDSGQGMILYAPEPAQTVRVALDPVAVEVDGVTRLELRHIQDGSPPTTAEVVSLGPAQITLEVGYRP